MSHTIDLRKNKTAISPKKENNLNELKPSPMPEKSEYEADRISSEQISWQTYLGSSLNKGLAMAISLILFSGGVITIYFKHDFILAILIFVAGTSILIFSGQKKKLSQIIVSDSGVFINKRKFGYLEIRSFWIDYQPRIIKELSLEMKKWHYPYIKIPLEKQNPLKIRNVLLDFIQEKEHKRSLLDLILNRFSI